MRKEAGLRTQRGTFYSSSQHSATWWSDGQLATKEAGLRAQRGAPCGQVCILIQGQLPAVYNQLCGQLTSDAEYQNSHMSRL